MMKPTLQLTISQQLTLTPQLQQAIRLLQLSSIELWQEIQQALESNPMLELADFQPPNRDTLTNVPYEQTESQNPVEEPSHFLEEGFYAIHQHDYTNSQEPYGIAYEPPYLCDNLHEHLLSQLRMLTLDINDMGIALTIIDAIDDNGYLCTTLQEIASTGDINCINLPKVESILRLIQNFEPTGVGARNLSECLLLQITQMPAKTPYLDEAKQIIQQHLNLLIKQDMKTICRRSRLSESSIKGALKLIQTLNPRPGQLYQTNNTEYMIPDIFVHKYQNKWYTELKLDNIPKLKINSYYTSITQSKYCNQSDNQFIKTHLQEARWLIKSLENRHNTLLKVAQAIVDYQHCFFEKGEAFMKPMTLTDIARTLNMHESTISRVTTKKYLQSIQGIFELKYFFSRQIETENGIGASSTAIRSLIKKLITQENVNKPLSDNQLVAELAKQGIIVARRTIAKYRESLSIPSSHQRKQLV